MQPLPRSALGLYGCQSAGPPTAKGFHFVTLEDERGFINVIVRPAVYARFRRVLRMHPVLVVAGTVEREGAVTNLIAGWVGTLRPPDSASSACPGPACDI